jgi:hypothetical protein
MSLLRTFPCSLIKKEQIFETTNVKNKDLNIIFRLPYSVTFRGIFIAKRLHC